MKKLTIGMTVFDDWNGFYFSIQSLRMHHSETMKDVEFVIINTNPSSEEGKQVKKFCKSGWIKETLHYCEDDNSMGTATRTKIFDYAQTPYVLVMDSHVMFPCGSIRELIGFFDAKLDNGNLVQGPLLYDSLSVSSTHFDNEWGAGMLGKWSLNKKVHTENYFEIPSQGLGVFACRKDSWLGFHKNHSGFGGEENTIHEKYRQHGKKTICLSGLKWLHRFARPSGIKYPMKWEDRVKNYFRSFLELDKPVFEIIEHFKSLGVNENLIRGWLKDVTKER